MELMNTGTHLELSAKITKSVYMHLEGSGVVAGDYLEQSGLSAHMALDSEMWLPSEKVELFLDLVSRDFPDFYPKEAALNANELRSWGLLDQVLRIMQSPSEIYEHPQKFLSYFIRPNLNFEWLERKDKISNFKISLSTDEMPLVTDYLTGALEVVAKYAGGGSSHVSWVDQSISIDWSKKQDSFFEAQEEPVNFKPEIYKEAVAIIQKQQTEITAFKAAMESNTGGECLDVDVVALLEDLKVLSDYFLRSRQLISLLKAESGKKKWFKEAVKRLNWDELQGLHTQKIEEIKAKLTDQPYSPRPIPSVAKGEQIGLSLDA